MDVYIVITLVPAESWNYSSDPIEDMEILDTPPRWFLRPRNQTCRVGCINGGDSIPYDNTPDLQAAAFEAGVPLHQWRDANGNGQYS
jgi:hypothetical protein